jgi:chitosanase
MSKIASRTGLPTSKPYNLQKAKIYKTIYTFENGSQVPKYDALVVMSDGMNQTKQITYGKLQTTEQGNLAILIKMYVNAAGKFAKDLKPYLASIGEKPLYNSTKFKNLLIKAGKEDPIMQKIQDDFFDYVYWKPALAFFVANGFTKALSMLVIFDSYIQSGSVLDFLRKRFGEFPPNKGGNEEKWINDYVDVRHQWLLFHSNPLLQNTVYRTNCFKSQLASSNWDLLQPINVLGEQIL